jgi:protein SCO1/2
MLGPLVRVLVVGLVLLTAVSVMTVSFLTREAPRPTNATLFDESRLLPEFLLTDQAGELFERDDLKGHYSLVFFGFTNCPDICPLTLQILADVRAGLKARKLETPEVVFISVDPDRDDPTSVAGYLGYFDNEMTGLVGPSKKLKPLLEFFGVAVHKVSVEGKKYNVTHTSAVFVIGPDAEYLGVFSSPGLADEVLRDFLIIRRAAESA